MIAPKMATVQVRINIKKKMLDAHASTILQSLNRLGFEEVVALEKSTVLTLRIHIPPSCKQKTQWLLKQTNKMCQTLLVNPVSQDFQMTVLSGKKS